MNITEGGNAVRRAFNITVDPNPTNQLVWQQTKTGEVVLWNTKHATFESASWLPQVDRPQDWKLEGAYDYDGDGDIDLLWRDYKYGGNVFWKMNGSNPSNIEYVWVQTIPDPDWHIVASGKFNSDNRSICYGKTTVRVKWRYGK